MFQVHKKVLNNGLRVLLMPMKNTAAVTFLILTGVGSRYESSQINGISHFLEHLFFKGTKKRPIAGQIARELDCIGAAYNAFTSKENTGFWVKTSSKDFDIGLDILSDMFLNPIFKEEEIEKERGVIFQEINMYEDDPRRRVVDILENITFKDQAVGRDVLGTKETVKKISKKDIIEYRKRNYFSENSIIAVAGDFDEKKIYSRIEKIFSKTKKGKFNNRQKTEILQKFPNIKILNKETDQTHLTLSALGYNMFDEKKYTLDLLAVLLGGNMSSKLFLEIREKLGLAYYVYAFGNQYYDCGYLAIGSGVPHERLEVVTKKIIGILDILKKTGPSPKDLLNAKGFIRGQTALRFESSEEVAHFSAGQELFYGKIMQPEEILKKIEKVSQNDILKIAREIFQPDKINMAVIGKHYDYKEKEEFYKKLFNKI